MYAQFFIRVLKELKGCVLGEFSKIKVFSASNFQDFRSAFDAKLERLFIVPAWTFDNVKGEFPIGFFVWDTKQQSLNMTNAGFIEADVFDESGNELPKKRILVDTEDTTKINDWLRNYKTNDSQNIGVLMADAPDFANQKYVCFINVKTNRHGIFIDISQNDLIQMCVYLAVRQCIPQSWLNDRDQFLFPNDGWQSDREFQADCLAFTLFHGQNRISCAQGVNNWIPFTEDQVGSKKAFKSNFMSSFIADFLTGKVCVSGGGLFDGGVAGAAPAEGVAEDAASGCSEGEASPAKFSPQAQAVYDAGLELWRYYHEQKNANPDAAFYDIRKYFQGEKNGRMNNASDDERYTELIDDLRAKQKALAKKIEANVYKYGFLK